MKKFIIPFFLLGTLVMIYIMQRTGAPLKTPLTPNGILNLEFANDEAKVSTVINAWASINKADLITAANENTWLDFIFIFFYAGFLFLCSLFMGKTFGGFFGKAGKWAARGALLAGILDILENTGMLMSLNGHISNPVALFTFSCSVVKWALAAAAVFYVFTGAVALVRTRLLRS